MVEHEQYKYILFTEENAFGFLIKANGEDIAEFSGVDENRVETRTSVLMKQDLEEVFQRQIDGKTYVAVQDFVSQYIYMLERQITQQVHEIRKSYKRIENYLTNIETARQIRREHQS